MTRFGALMLLGLMVTACTPVDSKDHWWRAGMMKDEFARDEDLCRQMATVQSKGAVIAGTRVRPSAELDENAYTICMEGAGYEKVPKDFVPPK